MDKVVNQFTLATGNTSKLAIKSAIRKETSTLALAVQVPNLPEMVKHAFQFTLARLRTMVGVNIYVTSMEQV